ncbi:MAG: methylated-DNA--[protein]-cysteine S-methyltransferase [Methanomassiliicoccaceae archaeon]|nr:methylated-DNA--[protein]-cysteine S-methyltransferase [Methanomassiliicoccaceae archaeon]
MTEASYASYGTPAGTLYICGFGETVTYIGFEKTFTRERITPLIENVIEQLNEYFNRERKHFTIPFEVGGSELQKNVCSALMKIPYGETRTYKDIAESAGNPKAIRAVATAIGKNPVSLVIPCHRVIGSDGKMRGYAGGIPFKEYLLELES